MFKKLFGKKEEKIVEETQKVDQKERSNTFLSFVLLEDNTYDFKKFVSDFKEDWNISLDDYESSDDSGMLVFDHEGMMIALSIMPAPIPHDEAIFHAQTNRVWEDAVSTAERHKAHLLISVLGRDAEVMDTAKLFVKVCATAINQDNATALDSLGTLFEPSDYREKALVTMNDIDMTPLYNLVYFGIYSHQEGTVSAYTYGLESFGKKEIEIINSKESAEDVYSLIADISLYILDYDAELLDGETIGFTEEQKLTLTESTAIALDPTTKTIKIGF